MSKYARLRERVAAFAGVTLHEPPSATLDELRAAHDDDWVTRVVEGALTDAEIRRIGFPWSTFMVERSRRSAGATLAAGRCVTDGGDDRVAVNLAGGTHHAGRGHGAGYCVFNDTAIATRVLVREQRAERVLVVDLDVHQGDGTAEILGDDDNVFTLSLHGRKNFPFRKQQSSLDIELDDGCGDDDYLAELERGLAHAFRAGRPDIVFFLAGADPFAGDALGRLGLTKVGLARRDAHVLDRCRLHNVAVVVAMAGGYATEIEDTVDIHAETVRQCAAQQAVRAGSRRENLSIAAADAKTPP